MFFPVGVGTFCISCENLKFDIAQMTAEFMTFFFVSFVFAIFFSHFIKKFNFV